VTDTTTAAILAEDFGYLEAARWHDGALWFSDIGKRRIHRMTTDGAHSVIATIAARPSGLGWAPDGALMVVGMEDQTLNRLAPDGSIAASRGLGDVCFHPNDMCVDPAGRAYITQFGYDLFIGAPAAPCGLLTIDAAGNASTVGGGLVFPNGVALTPDGRTLIVAESFGYRLTAFDVAADGTLSGQRVFAQFDTSGGEVLDGICVDVAGGVWVGMPFAGEFRRVIDRGTVTDVVRPAGGAGTYCVDCALGGADGRTLFLLVADTSVERMANDWDSTATVQTITVAVPGW
jgi:hypothetical protein